MSRMSELDIERQQYEADLEADSNWMQQQQLHEDVARVVELACRSLSPADQDLLRWATGIQKPEPNPAQMAVWDGMEDPF